MKAWLLAAWFALFGAPAPAPQAFAATIGPILGAGSNADLASYAINQAPGGLQRCGFLKPGDTQCLQVQPQAAPCSIVAFTGTITTSGSLPTNRLNVTAVASGGLQVGLALPAPIFTPGTIVVSQISGTSGGVGVYALSQNFSPPPTVNITVLGDGSTQIPSADGGCWLASPQPPFVPGTDIRSFGVVFDCATDNSAALQSALTFAAANNVLLLPATTSCAKFSTPMVVNLTTPTSTMSVVGSGRDASILQYTGTGTAITVNYNATSGKQNSTHWRDFTLCTPLAGTATGLFLNETAITPGQITTNDISNVTLRGCDGFGVTDYWNTAIHVHGVSEVNFPGLLVDGGSGPNGIGVLIDTTPPVFGFQYNFFYINMNNLQYGIEAGSNIQGVVVVGSNIVGINTGVYVTSGTGTDQLTVIGSQINCLGACVFSSSADNIIANNYFILSANNAFGVGIINGNNGAIVSGNIYRNSSFTSTLGEYFSGPQLQPNTVTGNTYISLANPRTYQTAGAFPDTVTGNTYSGLTSNTPLLVAGVTTLNDSPLTFATTVACAAALKGRVQHIVDSQVTSWGSAITTGGGVNDVLAYCDGTSWTVYAH